MPSHGCDRGTRGLLLLPLLLAASALLPLILLLRSCCCCCLEQLLAVQHFLLHLQNGRPINLLMCCCCCHLGVEVHDALLLLLHLMLPLIEMAVHGCCGRFESSSKHSPEPFLCSCCCFLLTQLLAPQLQARVAVVTLYLFNLGL